MWGVDKRHVECQNIHCLQKSWGEPFVGEQVAFLLTYLFFFCFWRGGVEKYKCQKIQFSDMWRVVWRCSSVNEVIKMVEMVIFLGRGGFEGVRWRVWEEKQKKKLPLGCKWTSRLFVYINKGGAKWSLSIEKTVCHSFVREGSGIIRVLDAKKIKWIKTSTCWRAFPNIIGWEWPVETFEWTAWLIMSRGHEIASSIKLRGGRRIFASRHCGVNILLEQWQSHLKVQLLTIKIGGT